MAHLCFRCGNPLNIDPRERVSRNDTCPKCKADIHACRNCKFYDINSYNHCREPQAERVLEKEAANYCDHFSIGEHDIKPKADHKKQLEELFKK